MRWTTTSPRAAAHPRRSSYAAPPTERDHATLIVNHLDDVFAKKRDGGSRDDDAKYRRRLDNSSTARLFPARPSPDIDNLAGSSIR